MPEFGAAVGKAILLYLALWLGFLFSIAAWLLLWRQRKLGASQPHDRLWMRGWLMLGAFCGITLLRACT